MEDRKALARRNSLQDGMDVEQRFLISPGYTVVPAGWAVSHLFRKHTLASVHGAWLARCSLRPEGHRAEKQVSAAIRKMGEEVTETKAPKKAQGLRFHSTWMGFRTCYLMIKGKSQYTGKTQATHTWFMFTPKAGIHPDVCPSPTWPRLTETKVRPECSQERCGARCLPE